MAEARPRAVVLAGPNGAGKSTLAPFLLRDTIDVSEFVNADTIALGLSAFRPETVALEAGRVMLRRLRELARNRASFAFETTLASRTFAPFLRRARVAGYRVELIYVWLNNSDLCIERIKGRVRSGGHFVEDEIVRRRYERSLRNFFSLYRTLKSAN